MSTSTRTTTTEPGVEESHHQLSVVMPVYNEEAVLEEVVTDIRVQILDKVDDSELVIVNDRSTDGTAEILDKLADDPRIRVHHSPVNRGHGPTLRDAIERADGSWVFHLDSDGQFVPGEFWDFWDRREQADLLLGVRVDRQDPRHRLLLTTVVRFVISLLVMKRIRDANVPFKLMSRAMLDDLRPLIDTAALAPSIMFVMGAALRGWNIKEIPVTHLARPHSASWLRLGKLARFSLRGLMEILSFRFRAKRA